MAFSLARKSSTLHSANSVLNRNTSNFLFYDFPLKLVLTSRPPLKQTVLGVYDFAKIIAGGPKNKLIVLCKIYRLVDWWKPQSSSFCSLGVILKKLIGSSRNFWHFFGFCAAVFSSTAAPKNNLIVSKWWDSPSLQTILIFFRYSAQKPRY